MPVWYAFWFLPPLAMAFAIAFTGTNREIFVWMQHASHVVPADVFSVFWQSATYAGDGLAVFALSALFLHRRPHAVWAGLLAAIPGGIITHGLKALHPFARPAVVLGRDAITILGPELHRSSFPSGHALSVGILAGIVFLSYRSHAVRTIALVFAAVVAVSRVRWACIGHSISRWGSPAGGCRRGSDGYWWSTCRGIAHHRQPSS